MGLELTSLEFGLAMVTRHLDVLAEVDVSKQVLAHTLFLTEVEARALDILKVTG